MIKTDLISRICFGSVIIFSLTLGGCAYTTGVAELTGNESAIPYAKCYPFLVVNGGQHHLLMVPNPNKERGLQFGTFLAKNSLEVTLNECGPNQLKSVQDLTEVAIKLFEFIGQLADTPIQQTNARSEPVGNDRSGTFQVFAFIFDRDGNYVGLEPQIRQEDFVRVYAAADPALNKNITQNQQQDKKKPEDKEANKEGNKEGTKVKGPNIP